ncbi:ABC transporter ATP-binding protein [Variovorax terrae]|uniref:ABC transporter ATP-binding protein n=1 Tax=Variovorax terrae TaxID=2923278 RepID=A0A9X1VYB9_9BURK|nr:ABC transporter ATP-binding protein [Variovorax terrae]MCJ0766136.1 ABC transporter ATP-binding protein [Variovorax terrae]
MNSGCLLQTRGVGVRFGGISAVQDFSFQVNEGELVGLLGPNGAGKTTLLRLISGVVPPSEGEIIFRDERINRLKSPARAQRGIALSHQIVRPFRSMTLIENVVLAAGAPITRTPWRALGTMDRHHLRSEAMQYLEKVGIAQIADRLPSAQPLGVLKRLEVARALATKPRLLLLDEPLAGLGHAEAIRLADLILELNAAGTTIVLIEHNLAEVIRICPRIVVLNNGQKMADGPAADVMRNPAVIDAYLGEGAAHVAH